MNEETTKSTLLALHKRETARYNHAMAKLEKAKQEISVRQQLLKFGTNEAERLRVRIEVLEELMEDTSIEEEIE
ncbi:hypothetical protein ACHAL6_00720 [Proteiniclasticum sp. C24MP]|uniref:hypothetical protein n=1 Tax=Proteiniclasticum sp. C24MP TaxID=3374101 RepID=UPI0037540C72